MIAFTICSNNYLAKAQILAKSIKEKEGVDVYLFLADEKSWEINYEDLVFDKVLLPEELEIDNLDWMLENYNVVEFNTAIKAAAFQFLFKKTPHDTIYYFDPDIKVYQPLSDFNFWNDASILLTPHILTPIPYDDKLPDENLFLNHGIYNLGFLGLKRSPITNNFLSWWSKRLEYKCVIDLKEGYFVDQIWFNLVPTLFGSVSITDHPGLNAAYWNLHERKISKRDGKFFVNDNKELFFYHFSSFDFQLKNLTPFKDLSRYDFDSAFDIMELYKDYLEDYEGFNPHKYKSIQYFDGKYPVAPPKQKLMKRLYNKSKYYYTRMLNGQL